ncbi:Nuclear pore complex protein NUP1-like protein, partial [Drosera capensis]
MELSYNGLQPNKSNPKFSDEQNNRIKKRIIPLIPPPFSLPSQKTLISRRRPQIAPPPSIPLMAAAAYNGSAGGKFRKKRHQATTPYDRPTTSGALRIAAQRNGSGWLSRIVDPASKVIAAGANRLFASVFRKQLLGPTATQGQQREEYSGVNEERSDSKLFVASNEVNHLVEEQAGYDRSLRASTNGDGIAELEKSNLEHLTALLHSRRTENLIGVIEEKFEATHEENHASHSEDVGIINGPVLENGFKHKVLEEEMASPVDLAKAYMASRSTRVSPSIPGSQIRSHAEDPPF